MSATERNNQTAENQDNETDEIYSERPEDPVYNEYLEPQKDITTRVVVSLIVIFGIASLVLGFWIIQQRLFKPFEVNIPELVNNQVISTNDQEIQAMRNKDTDGDRLNDYEEAYIHNTSPYLADSDSDGLNDGDEIAVGKDPNCKEGENCRTIRLVTPTTKVSDIFPQFTPTDTSLQEKTLAELRQIFIDSGLSQEAVDNMDDDFLVLVLEAIVTADDEGKSLDEYSESELRQFLIDMGLREDEVYRIPPAELREMINTLL